MLFTEIQSEIKKAMKSKDTDKKDVLKMASSKAQAIAKENKCEVSDEIVIDGIRKELKQLKQTKDSLAGKEDTDLYKSTVYKMGILETYLPKRMSEHEVREAIIRIIEMTGCEINKRSLMGKSMQQLKGLADGRVIAKCVDDIIKVSQEG